MKKILVTGGAGFIGSSLIDSLLATNLYYVVSVDNFSTGRTSHIVRKPNFEFIKCDVNNYTEIRQVMKKNAFDYVFHYAAVVGVSRTLQNPKLVLEDIRGFQNIFNLAIEEGVRRIFFSSSSEVYGETTALPQHEYNTPLNSRLPYAVVKNIGECFCRSYCEKNGLTYTIFRFFNTYGLKQSTDFVMSKFLNAAYNNQPITIYGDGNQKRTFCYIDDNLNFTNKVLENELFLNETVNVGHDAMITITHLAQKIIELLQSKSKITYLPSLEEGDMKQRQPDISKMLTVLNRPLITLEEGINRIIETKYINKIETHSYMRI